jgi:hypothetical protein
MWLAVFHLFSRSMMQAVRLETISYQMPACNHRGLILVRDRLGRRATWTVGAAAYPRQLMG